MKQPQSISFIQEPPRATGSLKRNSTTIHRQLDFQKDKITGSISTITFRRPQKKMLTHQSGQLSVFIILGILMLLTIGTLVLLAINQQHAPKAPISRAPTFEAIIHDLQSYIQGCMVMKAVDPITQLAIHGGRFSPNSNIFFAGTELTSFCTYTKGQGCVNSIITQSSLEKELIREIQDTIQPCIDFTSELRTSGAQFKTGTSRLNVSIGIDDVTLTLTYPVTIQLGPNQRDLSEFTAAIDAPLGRLFRTALDITNTQATTGFFDKDTYMAYHDSTILLTVHRPYPHIVYQLRRKDPKTTLDFLFQFAIAGKDTAGVEPIEWKPAFGCCFANDNTCHTNAPSSACTGKSEPKGCNCPSNAVPELEGCCLHQDGSCGITHEDSCTNTGDTYFANDRLCSKAPGCNSLTCEKTFDMPSRSMNGPRRKNGESWCIYDGPVGNGNDLIGSRHFVHSCIRGQEAVEPCRDFREELCAESKVSPSGGAVISHAACRINRFTDCTSQGDQGACEDQKVRDCEWLPAIYGRGGASVYNRIKCIPTVTPGLKFWTSTGQAICHHSSDDNPPRKRKRTWGHQVQHACSKSGDCGAKRNIADILTKEGYFNPDGDLEEGRLVPKAGENHIAYPGLPLSIDDRALPILPNLLVPPSGGGHAICSMWQAPPSGDCSLCESHPTHPCTEYTCKSLGQNCDFSERGLGIPTCTGSTTPPPGLKIPIITKLESSPSRIQPMGGTAKLDQYNIVPAIKTSEPLKLDVFTDQPTRCYLSLLSSDQSRNTENSWALCPFPGFPNACISLPRIYFSRSRLSTNHSMNLRIPIKKRYIDKALDLIKANIGITLPNPDFSTRALPFYLHCKNGNGTSTKEVEFKLHIAQGNDGPPIIVSISPNPDTVRLGQTTPIRLFTDRTFTECSVTAPGGLPIRLCGEVRADQVQFGLDAPPGTYECAGNSLALSSPTYTFTCTNENGQGPGFVYRLGIDTTPLPGSTPLGSATAFPSAFTTLPSPSSSGTGSTTTLPPPPTTPSTTPPPGQGCIIGCDASGWLRPPECSAQGIPLERGSSTCCQDRGFPCLEQEIKINSVVNGHQCSALRSFFPICGLS